MTGRRLLVAATALALATPFGDARAEVTAWDQAKVGALARQVATASDDLYQTFYKQPPPGVGSLQSRAYQRLKQNVRRLRTEARELASHLEKGAGQEETLPIYEELMVEVRDAREEARSVFTSVDVTEKASVVRSALNQLGPYYDPDFQALQPVAR